MIDVLEWNYSTTDIVNCFPTILSCSDKKLMTHARLFAQCGHENMPIREAASHIIHPLESHIITLNDENEVYSIQSVARRYNKSNGSERKKTVEKILDGDHVFLTKQIGHKAINAYKKYASNNK